MGMSNKKPERWDHLAKNLRNMRYSLRVGVGMSESRVESMSPRRGAETALRSIIQLSISQQSFVSYWGKPVLMFPRDRSISMNFPVRTLYRKTASGSKASFDRITQSSKALSLLIVLSPAVEEGLL